MISNPTHHAGLGGSDHTRMYILGDNDHTHMYILGDSDHTHMYILGDSGHTHMYILGDNDHTHMYILGDSDHTHMYILGDSDHTHMYIFCFQLLSRSERHGKWKITFNYATIRERLSHVKWSSQLRGNFSLVFVKYSQILEVWLDGCIPEQRKEKEALCKKNLEYKLWKRYTRTRSNYDRIRFNRVKDGLRSRTRNSRLQFENTIAQNIKTSAKPFWSYVNSKTKNKSKITPLKKADGTEAVTPLKKADGTEAVTPLKKADGTEAVTPLKKADGTEAVTPLKKADGTEAVTPLKKADGTEAVTPLKKADGTEAVTPLKKADGTEAVTLLKKAVVVEMLPMSKYKNHMHVA